jgi:acyl-CoA synthetase (AMP-forming)/AMP-acid ligase II
MKNLATALEQTVQLYPESVAIEWEQSTCTYEALLSQSKKISDALFRMSLQATDRVAVFASASAALIPAMLTNFCSGHILVPINEHFKGEELRYVLENTAARAIITDRPHLSLVQSVKKQLPYLEHILLLDELEKIAHSENEAGLQKNVAHQYAGAFCNEHQIALIFYTSGTTGKPKGAALTHGNILSNLSALKKCWQWSASDVLLHTLPLHHVHGFVIGLLGSLYAGSRLILRKKFDSADVLRLISEKKATLFMGVPTMYFRLLESEEETDVSAMRLFISGSAPLSVDLFHRFKKKFGHEILERAGMTETLMNFSNPVAGKRKPGSVGKPLEGVLVKIFDEEFNEVAEGGEGEIAIRGANVFSGYWNQAEATAKAFHQGWFLTGDVGRKDRDGYYQLLSRKKDAIKSGGLLIFPKEIEEVIEQLPSVKECAVIGVPDGEFGEIIKACVVGNGEELTAETIIEHCRKNLASFKKPKQVEFLASLPKNAMGKVLKEELRQRSSSAW